VVQLHRSDCRAARQQGHTHAARATGAHGATVTVANASRSPSTPSSGRPGFRLDHSFVELPVFDDRGRVTHERGVTELPGPCCQGHARLGAAPLVNDDVEYIVQRIGAFARPNATAEPSTALLSGPPAR
jgi:hypothetical protein